MFKKLTLLAMSVGALLALAAPAAQATTGPLITNGEEKASTGITAVSTNTITHTATGKLECTTVDLKLTAKENVHTTVKGSGSGEAKGTPAGVEPLKHSGHCNVSTGVIAEITSVNISDFHLTKHGGDVTGTTEFSFTYDLRSATGKELIAECTFGTSGNPITVKKTGLITINANGKIVKTAGGAFCPPEGTITGDFALTDEKTGKSVVFD